MTTSTENLPETTERAAKAAAAWEPGCSVGPLERMKGGRSSLTYVAPLEGASLDRIVFKVAPAGLDPVRNRDVLRQACVLKALENAPAVKVPRVLFEDPGAPPDVPPFFAMTYAEGDCWEPNIDPADVLPPPEEIEARAMSCARMLAALHAVSPADVGLGDEPVVGLEEEIERWVRAFGSVEDELKPGAADVAGMLKASMPDPLPAVIVHGDYRIGNTLCEGRNVNAIVDWEIWSLGDPRVDVAWFVLAGEHLNHPSAIRAAPGMPTREAMLAEYERSRTATQKVRSAQVFGRASIAAASKLEHLDWFEAHALFKVAAVTALLVKNSRKRGEKGDNLVRPDNIPIMISRARELLG
jgi:aminoglycoside phosphotransferase (APT) family kinase protein